MWTAFLILALCLLACGWLVDMSFRQERELFRLRRHWKEQAKQWAIEDQSVEQWDDAVILEEDEPQP